MLGNVTLEVLPLDSRGVEILWLCRVTFNTVMCSNAAHWEWVLALLANMAP